MKNMKNDLSKELMKKSWAVLAMACVFCAAVAFQVFAAESWKDAFDEICGKVQDSDALTTQELTALIEKADKLLPEIEKSEDPSKKIYLVRLKKCRAMFEFIIESRKSSGAPQT